MITDKEIEKIFEWADEFNLKGKRLNQYKWGIDIDLEKEEVRGGIPRDKELLLQLTHINLRSAKLTYIPKEFCKLKNLKWLDLYRNDLINLPNNFSELENLEWLDLSYNNLKIIKNLPKNLETIYLKDNEIEEISEDFKNLDKLNLLNLNNNNIENIENLPKNIYELGLRDNKLKNIDILNKFQFLKLLTISGIKNKEALRNFTSQTLKQLAVDNETFIPKDIAKKCPNIGLIEIEDNEDRIDDIEEMDFYKVGWDTGVLVRTPNIEKEILPQMEIPQSKPQKPFKNFLYKGE